LKQEALNIHQEIIDRCREGDAQAQHDLYRLYSKSMINTAFRICGNQEDAEDALQESFVNAFKHLKTYRGDATFGAWLKRIVVNKSLTIVKKSSSESIMLQAYGENNDWANDSKEELDNYSVEVIRNAIMNLPPGFRSVITLYLFEGYDHEEIGQILGVAESTSKTQYKRAKDKLRMILNEQLKYG
jgi:RNA polymerase sigma factor (sigma-70 family)